MIFGNVKLSHSSQSNWEISGIYFYASWQKGETCYNLVLQLRALIFKRINCWEREGFPRPVRMMEFQLNKFLQLQPQNKVNFSFIFTFTFWVYFHSSQSNWEICTNYFYSLWWKGDTYYNLVLQLMIFCTFTHILFSVNKSNFHFKGKSRIFTDGFNKINVSILQLA